MSTQSKTAPFPAPQPGALPAFAPVEVVVPTTPVAPLWLAILALLVLPSPARVALAEEGEIRFNRDIRPILSENCFHCHGPDSGTREAGLRLDLESAAKVDLGGIFAILEGDPGSSLVWQRVSHPDPEDAMPPRGSNRVLSEREKELLRRWIEQGAPYEAHWAYLPPQREPAPELEDERLRNRARNEIDLHLFAELERQGLSPSPEAARETLVRRAALDLTGLPPDPAAAAPFLAEGSEAAWEAYVDGLLASPRFGEHWARPWLDLARYADSNGFQADQLRDSWAYRDWVVDALNSNMPYDRFTIEQIAGDLLPGATDSQRIATGFHRTVTCNVEAGVHPEENRVNQVVDRVNTTATVWLGTTMECAQCHDHKYDPFSIEDYYQLYAYFNNTPLEVENRSGQGVQFEFYGPKMELPLPPERLAERERLEAELAQLRVEREVLVTFSQKDRAAWEVDLLNSSERETEWETLEVVDFRGSEGESHEILEDGSVLLTGEVPERTTYTVTLRPKTRGLRAIRLEALSHESLPGGGPGRGNLERPNFILNDVVLSAAPLGEDGPGTSERVILHAAHASFSQANWNISGAIDGKSTTGWGINPKFGESHWAVFEAAAPFSDGAGTELSLTLVQHYGGGRVIGRLRLAATSQVLDAEAMSPEVIAALRKPSPRRNPKERELIDRTWATAYPALRAIDAEIDRVESALGEIEPPSTLVMVELDEPRETRVHLRGDYLSPGEPVSASAPAALHPPDPSLTPDRLGLARWLVDPSNPLVARVAVNRWWAEIFGQGIVRTLEDFGTQSDPPSHPALLDWLALEFVESGWDMKHVLRQIALSAAYRQDSRHRADLAEVDPENRLLGRAPRFRLSAEAIRDQALAVSGLLSTTQGGPPVMPYQPPGIWRQVGRNEPKWLEAEDDHRWRRGLYVVWRRAAPYPSFVNFDAPDRAACLVERPRTNTPLQALTLLNDPAYAEMALALADRVLRETPPDEDARVEAAFRLVLGRLPAAEERRALLALLERRHAQYRNESGAAAELVAGTRGWFRPASDHDPAELAAWYHLASTLLNLDETVTKD